MNAPVFDITGARLREAALPDSVFGVEPNRAVMHQALVRQLANARQGTHDSQNRGEVNRTTKKWYRQKGTGNARHGSRRAPIFVGGGIAHGPHPRDYTQRMPRRMRRLALRSALSAKAAEGAVLLVDDLGGATRTKEVAGLFETICPGCSALVLLAPGAVSAQRSIRNLANVKYINAGYLNVKDILGHDRIVVPMDALELVVAHLDHDAGAGRGPSPTPAEEA